MPASAPASASLSSGKAVKIDRQALALIPTLPARPVSLRFLMDS